MVSRERDDGSQDRRASEGSRYQEGRREPFLESKFGWRSKPTIHFRWRFLLGIGEITSFHSAKDVKENVRWRIGYLFGYLLKMDVVRC